MRHGAQLRRRSERNAVERALHIPLRSPQLGHIQDMKRKSRVLVERNHNLRSVVHSPSDDDDDKELCEPRQDGVAAELSEGLGSRYRQLAQGREVVEW